MFTDPKESAPPEQGGAKRADNWLLQDRFEARMTAARMGIPVCTVAACALYFLAPTSVRTLSVTFFMALIALNCAWFVTTSATSTPSRLKIGVFASLEQVIYMSGLGWIMMTGAHDVDMTMSHRLIGWILYTFFGVFICDYSRSLPWVGVLGTLMHIGTAMAVWVTAEHEHFLAAFLVVTCTDLYTLLGSYRRRKDLRVLAELNIDKSLLAEQNERLRRQAIEGELLVASRIQASLAPPPATIKMGKLTVNCYHEPHGILGGDWMATRMLATGKLVIVVADVSGKGIPAAMVVQSVQTLWAEALSQVDFSPIRWMTAVNQALLTLGEKEPYTLTMGLVTIDDRELTYYSAGHVPLYIFRDSKLGDEVKVVHGSGNILGVASSLSVRPQVVKLPTDVPYRVVLGSDGVIDWETRRHPANLLRLISEIEESGREAIRRIPTADDKILIAIQGQPTIDEAGEVSCKYAS
jgi:hypothetical protein